jgi:lipid-binding SYLF domain-containing protein
MSVAILCIPNDKNETARSEPHYQQFNYPIKLIAREAFMKRLNSVRTMVVAVLFALAVASVPAVAQYYVPTQNPSEAIVINATNVFAQAMAMQDNQIPPSVLASAQGIAIVPGMLRGAFVIGLQHGRGVLLTRNAQGQWQAPRFIEMAGGSFGYQIGVQATDLVLVFRTPQSVNNVLQGTLKVGVDASAAAGPVGRQAAAGTDIGLSAEILSYSRARGAFIGVSIDGSSISLDPSAEAIYYQPPGVFPASAMTLLQTIAAYSAVAPVVAAQMQAPAVAGTTGGWVAAGSRSNGDAEATRQQLETSSRQLAANLPDDNWKRYLALPREIYTPNQIPSPQETQMALQKYEEVNRNAQYAALQARPDFQETLAGLRKLNDVRTASNASLQLPPPPR